MNREFVTLASLWISTPSDTHLADLWSDSASIQAQVQNADIRNLLKATALYRSLEAQSTLLEHWNQWQDSRNVSSLREDDCIVLDGELSLHNVKLLHDIKILEVAAHLQAEAGEVASALLKVVHNGGSPERIAKIVQELGDVVFNVQQVLYVLQEGDYTQATLVDAVNASNASVEAKIAKGVKNE